jgi:hypothetical protein
MNQTDKTIKIFSWMFLSTGIFAIVGALYTWGDGPLYLQDDLLTALVPWADLLFTGPISILAAYGVISRKNWGFVLGLMACGIYLFGSALVYISVFWIGAPYPMKLVLPPIVGVLFSIIYPIWAVKNPAVFQPQTDKILLKHAVKRVRLESV